MNCLNCNTEVNSNFCPDCGQPKVLKRINGHYIVHEIEHVLHFERGIFYTIKELITSPGQNIRNYLTENRSRLVKPIIFIIVSSLIYSISNHFFHFQDGYINYLDSQKTSTSTISKWVQMNLGYSNIMMGIFIALWTKLFFRKRDYNIFEILILLCFVMGIGMLIYAIFGVVYGLTHLNIMQFAGIAAFLYATWAIGQFYDRGKASSYVKAFLAYIFGMMTFSLAILLVGTLIDLVIKH
ncbi:DUF3667 domain-containing protein [Flavobacterium tructae]|uniref:DUF3667 domain-containing protein n=1 Tax=Flavobacterium tructae TaxID=1114873 RepID=A0A1S1J2K2_9FLAO|nr:DUF3667 domain-containing protein [Flavobacterium tructae]OHT43891.1 hypothetical protein BHE19_16255 [Flavobacterium tructae]OXB21595.1 hypothetical protein B0A71_03565 [Flavobacterium tructae]